MPWGWGWRGPWPGAGPFSYLPPWLRPGWIFGRGACWWFLGPWWYRIAYWHPWTYSWPMPIPPWFYRMTYPLPWPAYYW